MRRIAVLSLLLLSFSSVLFGQPPEIDIPQPQGPTAAATAFLDLMAKGDFPTAVQNFTERMKASLPPAKLAETWTSLQTQRGLYKRRIATRTMKQGLYEMVLATTEFERGTVDLKVLVNERGRIAGFFIVPDDAAPAPADPG